MGTFRKRTACLLASLMLVAGTLSGCGPSGCSASNGGPGAQTASVKDAKTAEAVLVSFDGSTMVVTYEGQEYTLDLSGAEIRSLEMNVGDTVVVTYTGELKVDDATAYRVISVEAKDDADADVHEVVGTLEDITMNAVTIRTIEGRVLTFNANNVKHSFSYGVTPGNWVTVIYSGDLVGTDTSTLSVIEIHDEDTDYVKKIKAMTTIEDADETAYALEDVDLRSSYMMASEVVGALKAREAVTVTGRCNNGWDRISHNGQTSYVYGSLLTSSADESGSKGTTSSISEKVNIKSLDEIVYTKTDATVRAGYSTASQAIGALKAGSSIWRTGICDNGWSQIRYDGRVAYVYSDLLTTKNPNTTTDGVKTTAVNETVYISSDANVRKSWTSDSELLGTLKAGEKIVRTGICDNGWSRVSYNRQDAYVMSSLLSKTDPNKGSVTIYKQSGTAWTTASAHVRESYTTDSKVLGTLAKGERITVTGVTDNNWSRIKYGDKVGFVHNDLLTSQNPNPSETIKKGDQATAEGKIQKGESSTKVTEESKKEESKAGEETDKGEASTEVTEENKKAEAKASEKSEKGEGSTEVTEESKKSEEKAGEETDKGEASTEVTEESKKGDDQGAGQGEDQGEQGDDQGDEQVEQGEDQDEQGDDQVEGQGDDQGEQLEQGDDQGDQAEDQGEEAVDTKQIEGIVVNYSLESITIEATSAVTSTPSATRATDEPELNTGTDTDEYPSITYDEAQGSVTTYYTFDIRQASQQYTKGVGEGLTVRVTFVGDLSDMSGVHATNVTDAGVKSQGYVYRGTVTSTTENTMTVRVESGVENTFTLNGVNVDKSKLLPGAEVKVIADLKGSKLEENIFKAIKVDIVKEAEPAPAENPADQQDQGAVDDASDQAAEPEEDVVDDAGAGEEGVGAPGDGMGDEVADDQAGDDQPTDDQVYDEDQAVDESGDVVDE